MTAIQEDPFLTRLSTIFSDAGYPGAIADAEFRLLWCSDALLRIDPSFSLPNRLLELLGDRSVDLVRHTIDRKGRFLLTRPGMLPGRAVCLCALEEAQSAARYLVLPALDPDAEAPTEGVSLALSAYDAQYRRPLASIFSALGALQRLNAQNPDETARSRTLEYLESINRSAYLLRRSGDMLGMFTRLMQGLWPDNPRQGELVGYLRELLFGIEQSAEFCGIECVAQLPDRPIPLSLDFDKLETALGCLFSNALRCTPTGGTVRLSVKDTGEHLQFRISDSGPGVPEDQLTQICAPFYSRSPQGEPFISGGLGLPIAKSCILALGGTLVLSSPPGEGLTALFTLPLPPPDTQDAIRQELLPFNRRDRQSALRVLLADAMAPPLE